MRRDKKKEIDKGHLPPVQQHVSASATRWLAATRTTNRIAHSSQQEKARHARCACAPPSEATTKRRQKPLPQARPVLLQLDRAGLIAAPTLDRDSRASINRIRHYRTAKVIASRNHPSAPCPMDTTAGTHQRTARTSCPPTNKW